MSQEKYKTSKAVVMESPRKVNFREIKLTGLQPDSYVAQTTFSAISSGTDMKTWRGEQHPEQCYYPLVPGYENVGVIVHAGPETDGKLAIGDRVMINECREFGDVCAAWGGSVGFSIKDSTTAPSPFDYMVKIPENVTDEEAVLAYLPCVALKGIKRMSFNAGDVVVVIGAGMIGISAMQIVKIMYPEVKLICVERNAFRCSLAEKYVDYVFDTESAVEEISKLTDGNMADKLIECSGNSSVVGTLHKYIKSAGWVLTDEPAHIHLQGDYPETIVLDSWHRWFTKNCTVTMTCALAPECKEQILQWISEGKFDVKSLPVESWPVAKCAEAYEYKEKSSDEVFKVILDWRNA